MERRVRDVTEQGLWRLTLHERAFQAAALASSTAITELTDCYSRRLETALNAPAKLTFSIDGRSQAAFYINELSTEVMAWRQGRLMFRGIVAQSQDSVSEQAHTVNFTVHDYWAMLIRRYTVLGADLVYTALEQDDLIWGGLALPGIRVIAADGTNLQPGSLLPMERFLANPDGTVRTVPTGITRDRTYTGGQSIGDAITDLTGVINGPGVDVLPHADADGMDYLRIFWPTQGIDRVDTPLVYGATVSSFSRSVNSGDYANYIRVVGQNPDTTPGAPQLFSERHNPDANNVTVVPVGLWMTGDNASDVSEQQTLNEKADGLLKTQGTLVPSYSLMLRPGWFVPGKPALGDTVPLVIKIGRLDVSATVRILGINYDIGDDGQEDVELTVGRPIRTLDALFRDTRRDINALARR
jgi:hypothetical protein